MDDFSSPGAANHYGIAPSESNYIKPGKKPLSSISPTLVFRPKPNLHPTADKSNLNNQDLALVLGASGGPKIPTATLQAFVNYVFRGLPLYESVVRPRLHDQLLFQGHSTTLYDHDQLLDGPLIETPERTRNALVKRNHEIDPVTNTGCVQAIAIDLETGTMTAVSDPRKGGKPAGY